MPLVAALTEAHRTGVHNFSIYQFVKFSLNQLLSIVLFEFDMLRAIAESVSKGDALLKLKRRARPANSLCQGETVIRRQLMPLSASLARWCRVCSRACASLLNGLRVLIC